MITLFKSPLSEHVLPDAPFYPLIVDAIKRHEAQKSYVPLLLGMIRNDGVPEAILGADVYKKLGNMTYYCIDYYEYTESYSDAYTFRHVTTLGKNEKSRFKQSLLKCFDPRQEVSRVRLALDAIKDNNSKLADVWVKRCLQDPVTKKNNKYFVDFLQQCVCPSDLSQRNLPLAKKIIDHLLDRDPKHPAALGYLADIGELYRMGAEGVGQDLQAAERYFLRVVHP